MTTSDNGHHEPDIDDHSGIETTGHEWDGIKELNNPLPRWWLIIFYVTIAWAFVYYIFMPSFPGLKGIRNHSERVNVTEDLATLREARSELASRLLTTASLESIEQDNELRQFAMAAGKSAFGDNCATCHGVGGVGYPGYPSLADDVWLWGGTLDDIRLTITHGIRSTDEDARFSQMPAYGEQGMLSGDQINDLATYVLNYSEPQVNEEALARAEPLFQQQCSICHAEDGTGDRSQGAPNLTDAEWLYGGDYATIRAQIWNGRNGIMPNWGERLDDATIASLAVYVHSLGGGETSPQAAFETGEPENIQQAVMPFDGSEHMSEVSAAPEKLYAKREAVHPQLVHGKYRFTKWLVLFATLGVYYFLPWLRWPRAAHEPQQAVLVDFEGARLYFFNIEIWPDEFYLVTGILVLSALALFFVTSVWGRLWCGYACPQTVWTDLFIAVERMVEGDRNKRLQLAKKPWTADKILKKVTKHSLWLLIAMATGGAWVLYFHDAPTVISKFFVGQAPASSYLFVGVLTFTTYSLAGLMREQVCTYMCPWPRIQGAMTDDKTFAVGYYALRGEPRGKHKKGQDWSELGDCIDCHACVTACPMGIDIRDGDQLECINCGLCVDACDTMMKKVGLPKGLIAYGADYRDVKDPKARRRWPQIIRPRTLFYAGVTILASAIMLFGLTGRSSLEFGVERDRAPAFTRLSDGSIRNAITARVLNKQSETHPFTIEIDGPEELTTAAVGYEIEDGQIHFDVAPDKQIRLRIFLTMPKGEGDGDEITVTLTDDVTGETSSESLGFLGGSRRQRKLQECLTWQRLKNHSS